MPYTPPATRSPASSTANTAAASRRPPLPSGTNIPSFPRSASYLTRKPRRTDSWSERNAERTATTNTILNGAAASPDGFTKLGEATPPGTSEDLQKLVNTDSGSLAKGGVISPPDSSNSSGDEGDEITRGRQFDRQIKELQEAISHIPQRPSLSPPRKNADDAAVSLSNCSAISSEGMHHSFSTGSLVDLVGRPRRVSHVRSNTEPSISMPRSAGESLIGSEDGSDDDAHRKPAIVRKKSGELVRPALRPTSRKRPSSMPGTPTFSKNVHFDACLEQVRHFCDIDRPSAVSAGSSPVETHDTDDEFPFHSASRSPPLAWEIALKSFPAETADRKSLPVRLERVWISTDNKSLMGSVVVANLAFHKLVVCRFTLDNWKTVSEVAADYVSEVHPREGSAGHDRFHFSIKLSDTTKLESKTLYLCARYNVNGVEYWDNNNQANFRVDFKKRMLPQNGKNFEAAATRAPNALPRSNRRPVSISSRKPHVSPAMERFGADSKPHRKSIQDVLEESDPIPGIRLKGIKSTPSLASDNLSSGLGAPSGQAFSNRYDFGASLSAAKQAARNNGTKALEPDSDGLYMKPNRRGEAANAAKARLAAAVNTSGSAASSSGPSDSLKLMVKQRNPSTSTTLYRSGSAIASAPYEEILNKYCFYGSKAGVRSPKDHAAAPPEAPKPEVTPAKTEDSEIEIGSSKDAEDSRGVISPSSSCSSSPGRSPEREPTAQHHSLYPISTQQYLYSTPTSLSSPLRNLPQADGRPSSPALGSAFTPLAATPIRS